tara:strand:- start:635 stop:1111 length:477 start_codon:yes stop_codon:yes gene_type:complete
MLDISQVGDIVANLIGDDKNGLTEEHAEIVKELYMNFREIIVTTFEEEKINDVADLAGPFWFKFLKTIMESVDNFKILGSQKKEIVIELICLVIMNEVDLADDIKEEVVKQVRNCAPSAIDLIVDVSKHIDINNIKVDSKGIADFITKKLLCCIFPQK